MIAGSLADRDDRIQKGDRVLSINGRSTKEITHREALTLRILKVRIKIIMKRYYTLLARPSCPLSLSVLGCQDKSDAY